MNKQKKVERSGGKGIKFSTIGSRKHRNFKILRFRLSYLHRHTPYKVGGRTVSLVLGVINLVTKF